LLEISVVNAINLDEEDSTAMFFNSKVINKSFDKESEYKVSKKILVFRRKKH